MPKKTLSLIAAAGVLLGSCTIGYAQSSTREMTPGDKMQDKGSLNGAPGASGYAPGHEMQKKGSLKGSVKGTTGASRYAPGRATTGSGSLKGDADVNVKAGSAGAKTDIDAGSKINKR